MDSDYASSTYKTESSASGPSGSLSGAANNEYAESYEDLEEEDDEFRFADYSLLSNIAVRLKYKVPRSAGVGGSIPHPRAFTGKDIVGTIQSLIQRELAIKDNMLTADRSAALGVARSLQSQLFFYDVEWTGRVLQDGVEDLYVFQDDLDGPSGSGTGLGRSGLDGSERGVKMTELPTGIVTALTKCYSPGCEAGTTCYSPMCPRKRDSLVGPIQQLEALQPLPDEWIKTVAREVLVSLSESEVLRQTTIHKLIDKEEQYLQDLDTIESVYIRPLQANTVVFSNIATTTSSSKNSRNTTIIAPFLLDAFIDEVFGNILEIRECHRRMLETLRVRQREQSPVIQCIGDIFSDAVTEFRSTYLSYVGQRPLAEKRLKEEMDGNAVFRFFLEQCARKMPHRNETVLLDLKHYLDRPSEHLQEYPVLLEAILNETVDESPDADFLSEAVDAISNLQSAAQLHTFQNAMGRGAPGQWEWYDLVSQKTRATMSKVEQKRQMIIFELIEGEMSYMKDLESIEIIYIRPLREADPQIIDRNRLDRFIIDVFHNFAELHVHHRQHVERLQKVQREQHPAIRSITAAMLEMVLDFRDAYMMYIPNYSVASYKIDEEMANNPAFRVFVDQRVRHVGAHRSDMKNFLNRPVSRLLRYQLLLKNILDETPDGHDDKTDLPQVLEVIRALVKDTEPGVISAQRKVELWGYNSNIVFNPGEWVDMDLLNEKRSLIHTGSFLFWEDGVLKQRVWNEVFVLLFDNYFVITKPKEKDGITKYAVIRRPISLDLLTLVNFTDAAIRRGAGLLRNMRSDRHENRNASISKMRETEGDSRFVYPCTIHHKGRMDGSYVLYAESAQVRAEWKEKLKEALGLRKLVLESNTAAD